MRKSIVAAVSLAIAPGTAWGKDLVVRVDARSAPWSTGINRKLPFGLADAQPPKVVFDPALTAGAKVSFKATGRTITVFGGGTFGPDGQGDWTSDRGMALFPSHYMRSTKRPIHLNELVGAFIGADGAVVGEPFPIGSTGEAIVPEGASGIALGINDDRHGDNSGGLTVSIHIPEARVYVEGERASASSSSASKPASTKTLEVKVSADAGPWDAAANGERMPYGLGDAKAAVLVPFDLGAGTIAVIAEGTTATPDVRDVGPQGIAADEVDDKTGARKRRYPSFYTPKILYPVHRHALLAAFVDEKGVVVGRPIAVNAGIRLPIPSGAAALSLGFNDVGFAGNTGALKVTVVLPE